MKFLLCVTLFAVALIVVGDLLPVWLIWAGSVFLILLGGSAVLANWTVPFRKGGGSMIPLFGGLFVAFGFAVIPLDSLQSLWWVPLFADPGCVPILALAACHVLWRSAFPARIDTPPTENP